MGNVSSEVGKKFKTTEPLYLYISIEDNPRECLSTFPNSFLSVRDERNFIAIELERGTQFEVTSFFGDRVTVRLLEDVEIDDETEVCFYDYYGFTDYCGRSMCSDSDDVPGRIGNARMLLGDFLKTEYFDDRVKVIPKRISGVYDFDDYAYRRRSCIEEIVEEDGSGEPSS